MARSLVACVCSLTVLTLTSSPGAHAQDVLGELGIKGAGSTFVYPVLARWSSDYRAARARATAFPVADSGLDDPAPNRMLEYEPVGSLAGILRLKDRAVDFAISDRPMRPAELAEAGLVQFPIVLGGIAIAVNLEGVGDEQLRLSGPILSDIFLGRISRWTDRAIAAQNLTLRLPDSPIVVIHRSEGSGTTFNFSNFLSEVSAEWRAKIGSGFILNWPTGKGAKGNEGVARLIAGTRNSIGYVEASQAAQTHLRHALIQNISGRFVGPSGSGFQASAAPADWDDTTDFYRVLANSPGANAYPLTAAVFVLMPKSGVRARTMATLDFFSWALERGGDTANKLGYAALPPVLTQQITRYWARTLRN